ncbi:MAG: DinB family protein [Planctomycetota bacterium]
MDVPALVARLESFPDAVDALVRGLDLAAWRWRPADGGWSALEIVGHLRAEERDDFRVRLGLLLRDPAAPWAPLDAEAAVTVGRFQELDPATTLAAFRAERAASVAWLRTLDAPRWDHARATRDDGPLHAGDLLASWVAHDARHLGQLAKRLHGLAARDGAPFSVRYAG